MDRAARTRTDLRVVGLGLAIDADQRGRGFGREAMLLAEDRVREHGGSTLGLNVFGFNAAGRALYESLAYETTSVRMLKKLS